VKSYEIIVTPDAEADLYEIRDYIVGTLLVPDLALHYIRAIRREIEKLSYMADSIAPEEGEPWHSRGVRKIIAKNFYIYYRPDDKSGKVYILNIIYAKRDQIRALKNMDLYDK
jgi:toxin ParE1/3/4